MNDITSILQTIRDGDVGAADQLIVLVYNELRKLAAHKLARESPDHTLTPTALVHEAYLRLIPNEKSPASGEIPLWNNRGHFFGAAAEAMRRILVEKARRKQAEKHGGGKAREELREDAGNVCRDPLEILAVDEALEELAQKSPRKAELVKLRYFMGCKMAEAADILDIAIKTAEEDWTYAKAWLRRYLRQPDEKNAEI